MGQSGYFRMGRDPIQIDFWVRGAEASCCGVNLAFFRGVLRGKFGRIFLARTQYALGNALISGSEETRLLAVG